MPGFVHETSPNHRLRDQADQLRRQADLGRKLWARLKELSVPYGGDCATCGQLAVCAQCGAWDFQECIELLHGEEKL